MEIINTEYIFNQYGNMIYLTIFLTICGEIATVFTAFLPGDSIAFAAGALSATGKLNIWIILIIVPTASIIGNSINYFTGRLVGVKIISKFHGKILNENNVKKAHNFYEKHGELAVVGSRFLPLFRSWTPFAAGIAKMDFVKFSIYNCIGSIAWSIVFIGAGFFLGNLDILKNNLWILTLISLLSPLIMVGIITIIRHIAIKRGDN